MRILFLLLFSLLIFKQNVAQGPYNTHEDLQILSWNIHMLPSFIYYKTKKRFRAKAIAEELKNSEFNIIVFQEAFHKRVKKKMEKLMKEKFPFSYGPTNKKFFTIWTNDGIWFLSDRPLIHLESIRYNECTGDGCYARKGAVLMEGEHMGNRFQLMGTHNNGGWINNSQFHQVRTELLDKYETIGVPQIICGDFNTNKSSANNQWEVMTRLFDVDTTILQSDERAPEHQLTFPTNDIYHRFPDFIFIRNNQTPSLQINRLSMFSLGPTWVQEEKKIYLQSVGWSDHFPVRIQLNWKE